MITGIPLQGTAPVFAARGPLTPIVSDLSQRIDCDLAAWNRLISPQHTVHSSQARLWGDVPIVDEAIHLLDWLNEDPLRIVVGICIGIGLGVLYSTGKTSWFRYQLRGILERWHGSTLSRIQVESLLIDAYELYSGADSILGFAAEYDGPSHRLEVTVQERLDFLRDLNSGERKIENLGELLPAGSVRNRWNVMRAHGWTIELAASSGADRAQKRIYLANTLAPLDPRLSFFADLTMVQVRETVEQKWHAICKNLEHLIYEAGIFKHVPDWYLDDIVEYLVHREVFLRTLAYYAELRETEPGVRMRQFEAHLRDFPEAERRLDILKMQYSHIDSAVLDRLDDSSLEELMGY